MMIRVLVALALLSSSANLGVADEGAAAPAQNETAAQDAAAQNDAGAAANSLAKIEWEADYGQALAATRQDKRPLLVVLEDPSTEPAQIDAQPVGEAAQEAELLEPYHLCRIDATTEYGKKVVRAFGAEKLPHTSIIDKTGAVVLYKQSGPISRKQWKTVLTEHRLGERRSRAAHSTFYRGMATGSQSAQPAIQSYPTYTTQPSVSSPSYCPSCQRRGMQSY